MDTHTRSQISTLARGYPHSLADIHTHSQISTLARRYPHSLADIHSYSRIPTLSCGYPQSLADSHTRSQTPRYAHSLAGSQTPRYAHSLADTHTRSRIHTRSLKVQRYLDAVLLPTTAAGRSCLGGRLREDLALASGCVKILPWRAVAFLAGSCVKVLSWRAVASSGGRCRPRVPLIQRSRVLYPDREHVKSCTRERERLDCWCSQREILTFQPATATDPRGFFFLSSPTTEQPVCTCSMQDSKCRCTCAPVRMLHR